MVTILACLLQLRVLLKNGVLVNPKTGSNISASVPRWYYVKCPKAVNCSEMVSSIGELNVINERLFTAYLTPRQAIDAVARSLKLEKVRKRDKVFRNSGGDNLVVVTANKCVIPFPSRRVTRNVYMIDRDDVMSRILAIPCVRAVDKIDKPRFDMSNSVFYSRFVEYGWNRPVRNPFREYGLDGRGQVVSIVDGGVDPESCWFWDSNQDVEYNRLSDHRKIRAYFRESGANDTKDHGTFVAGIIAGRAVCSMYSDRLCSGSFYDGIAPNADIVVHEFHGNMDSDVWEWSANASRSSKDMSAGVQYHGFDYQGSSLMTYVFDSIAYETPEMLFVFPAGDRTNQTDDGKIPSPGDSKNVLTVGAVSDAPEAVNQVESAAPIIVVKDGVEYMGYCDPHLGVNFFEYVTENPELLKCTYIVGDDVLILTPAAFDLSAVRQRFRIILLFNNHVYKSSLNQPVIRMPPETHGEFNNGDALYIRAFIDAGTEPREMAYSRSEVGRYGMTKPDVMFPGGPVFGPRAGSTKCGKSGVRLGEGTSVSAAFATGYAALIRQHLGETTGHLLRAVFVHCSHNRIPNFVPFFGFGNVTGNQVRTLNGTLNADGADIYDVRAVNDGELKVTVAWNDPPHDPFSPSSVLFDLRLSILNSDGDEIVRDMDPFNTVKTIRAPVGGGDQLFVRVSVGSLSHYERVDYSLVITAPLSRRSMIKRVRNEPSQHEPPKKDAISLSSGVTLSVTGEPYVTEYFEYNFPNWAPGHSLEICIDRQTGGEILSMLSIGSAPTVRTAHCTLDNCPWASTNVNNCTVLSYHLWDFVHNERMYIGVRPRESVTYKLSLKHVRT